LFHGYAPGYAQIIESPTQFQITPMQIDTWNRDKMNLTGSPFVPGPLLRNSLAPTNSLLYSGMLECPVTTRIRKNIQGAYVIAATAASMCDATIATAAECFAAAKKTLAFAVNVTKTEGSDPSKPEFCSMTSDAITGDLHVFFNKAASTFAPCGDGAGQPWSAALLTL
jgi:hypothetical protein